MKLVTLNARQYAVDLWWQVRSGEAGSEKSLLRGARSRADDLKAKTQETFNCVVLCQNQDQEQYGLGSCSDAKIPRVSSLAAALHPPVQAVQSFLGIFHLNEGWWVCGQSRGLLSANGDRLFETEQDAHRHAEELRDYFDASCVQVVCQTPEESELYLLPLLQTDIRVQRLYTDARHLRILFYWGLGVLGLLLLGGGIKWIWDERMVEQTQNATRQLLQGKEARRREILADQGRYFPQEWLETPLVQATTAVCLPALMTTPFVSNGWTLDSAACKGNTLLLTWAYRPGASYTNLPPDARLDMTQKAGMPKKAVSQQTLTPLSGRREDHLLLSQKEARTRLYELTRQTRTSLRLAWEKPKKTVVDEVEVIAPWVRGTWQLEHVPATLVNSGSVFALLDALPGLSIGEVHMEKHQWNLKGVVYANLR